MDPEIRISPIERDRHFKEIPPEEPPSFLERMKAFVLTFLLEFVQKIMPESGSPYNEQPLKAFQLLLQDLAHENIAEKENFLLQLSDAWSQLLLSQRALSKISLRYKRLRSLLDEISHFPSGEEHSLGYYLTEHAGKSWTPLPCIALLSFLHEEGIQLKTRSHLYRWQRRIDEILQN